ncbi:MAG: rRNA pseudouridine synthase [Deinococcales bacterium]|nr:rRNA pseudouridine synthase [Chitinophagaceae bacterium]
MAKHAFDKFMNNEPKGAKKKEMVKVEKRRAKADSKAVGDQKRREKYDKQHGIVTEEKPPVKKGFKKQDSKLQDNKQQQNKQQESKLQDGKPQESKFTAGKKPAKAFIRSNSDKYYTEEGEAPKPRAKTATIKQATSVANAATEAIAEDMPLNKFIAHGGVCGRREAAELVKQRLVTVNGDIVYEPGYKVSARDEIKVKGKQIFPKKNLVYILLNKPKDYLTTSSDPDGRKTVLDLLKGATPERIYPVGRLDRNTTGVLLLTNDGELAQKLTHPSFQIKKVYAVKLDKPLTKRDFDSIVNGINLEDGEAHADSLAYADSGDKSNIGIEIHNGRNRIVRRIFEHLGYEVKALDRVMFANLTKKNVERSRWRFLNEKEIRLLKYMNQSFIKKAAKSEESAELPE